MKASTHAAFTVRTVSLAVAGGAIASSALGSVIDARFGYFGAAFLLGMSQLPGP